MCTLTLIALIYTVSQEPWLSNYPFPYFFPSRYKGQTAPATPQAIVLSDSTGLHSPACAHSSLLSASVLTHHAWHTSSLCMLATKFSFALS